MKTIYPTPEKIIEYNLLILNLIKTKKADQPKLLSYSKLTHTINECIKQEGDLYDKATTLLKELIQKHPFASGNRRTAFITTKAFLQENKQHIAIKNDPTHAKAMTGIRENYYNHEEIKRWLQHGKIREFKR
ncbi:MAG: type II toxin-antitoxin system death-on-curing family toxin [Nanoarchaeota archaeon]